MPEAVSGISYIRKSDRTSGGTKAIESHPALKSEARQIWELLATPQTVQSLRKSLGGKDAHPEAGDIAALLDDLLRKELIEVSPDS